MTLVVGPTSRLPFLIRWLVLLTLVSITVGLLGGCFLRSLSWVTKEFQANPIWIYTLPVGGVLSVWLYQRWGGQSAQGVRLLVAEIKTPTTPLPVMMAPLIFCTTLVSHLGGASVGREGTALQLGGGVADQFSRFFNLSSKERQTLLLCGVSAGFSAVFGAPIAAAVFAVEFVKVRHYLTFLCCLLTSFAGNYIGKHWVGAVHWDYKVHFLLGAEFTWGGLASVVMIGAVAGLVARLYLKGVQWPGQLLKNYPNPYYRILLASFIFGIWIIPGKLYDFTGLGLPIIDAAFCQVMPLGVWILKFSLTVICVGLGFRGGEVTPLFFVGATLGSALCTFLPLPLVICTGLGFVAVFAGVGNVPLSCTVLAAEAFHPGLLGYALLACYLSALIAGRHGLYDQEIKP
jgi:H+/Cl- antiporter ClcA